MKLSKETVKLIIELKNKGLSSRKIAEILNVGKTTVNDNYSKYFTSVGYTNSKPKVLVFDVEILPSVVATFGRYNVNISHDNVLEEGGQIVSAAWKWLGTDIVHTSCMTEDEAVLRDDKRVVEDLWLAFEESDIAVAHNCNGFDKKVFNTRLAINGIPPHKPVKFIDTLQIAKSMKFNSAKLDSLCDYFGLDRKIQTGGIKLWIDCMNGCPIALAKMQEYNAADVEILSQLYYKLQPFNTSTPNLGMYYNDGQMHCPACGSTALEATGNTMNTNLQKFQEVVCKDCGHRSKHRKSISTKQHKGLQLSSK